MKYVPIILMILGGLFLIASDFVGDVVPKPPSPDTTAHPMFDAYLSHGYGCVALLRDLGEQDFKSPQQLVTFFKAEMVQVTQSLDEPFIEEVVSPAAFIADPDCRKAAFDKEANRLAARLNAVKARLQ